MRVTMAATTGHKSLRLFSERLNARNIRALAHLALCTQLTIEQRQAADACAVEETGCKRRLD